MHGLHLISTYFLEASASSHRLFWRENPALLLGISVLLGTGSYLYLHSLFFPILWLLYLFFVGFNSLFRGICFLALGAAYSYFLYGSAPNLKEPLPVQGIFSISSLKPHQSPFQRGLMYKGTLRLPEEVPCSVCINGDVRPIAKCDYWVSGTLEQRGPFEYSLKMKEWKPLASTWSLAEMRYTMKEQFRTFLKKSISSPQGAALLGSLITGDVEDRQLRYEFSRLGLQHLLSISGFHFAVLIAFCSGFLGLFLPEKFKLWTLLFALTAYFVFVGSAPAVLRSFITAILYVTGKLLRRQPCGLNLLGCAMLFELILDPLAGKQIGFQLSFISCGGLLLLFPQFDRAIQKILPKRSLSDLAAMSPLSPFGYLLATFLRKGVALTLAVNVALLPLLLYHFHFFPLLGILYNLFFPLCVSAAIFLLLTGLIGWIVYEPLGNTLLSATNFWTSQLIDLASYPPLLLDRSIRCADIPDWACVLYLFTLFLPAIHFKSRR